MRGIEELPQRSSCTDFVVRGKLFLAMKENRMYHSLIIMQKGGGAIGKIQYRYLLSDSAVET